VSCQRLKNLTASINIPEEDFIGQPVEILFFYGRNFGFTFFVNLTSVNTSNRLSWKKT
jgi:hypothetical protein